MSSSEKTKIVEQILGKYYTSGDEMLFYCPRCIGLVMATSKRLEYSKQGSFGVWKKQFVCSSQAFKAQLDLSISRNIRQYGRTHPVFNLFPKGIN